MHITPLVLLLAFSGAAIAHRCIHDDDQMQALFAADTARGVAVVTGDQAARRQSTPQSMRFSVFTPDLSDPNQYCTRAGQVVADKKGGTVTCTSDDILTDSKRAILVENIIPAATARLSGILSLQRVTGNIIVSSSACLNFTIPAAHTSTGVSNADYVLYVSAAPTGTDVLAWAGGCSKDSAGRYIVGRANFGPKYIAWDSASTQADVVATATHELIHALGFTSDIFQSGGATQSTTLRGKTATLLTYPLATAAFKNFIGCDSSVIAGVELEDEGGSGSALSHWDRRVLKDELMAAAGGTKLSALTLSALQAQGHYTADFSKAEDMSFGADAGCSYVTAKCNTVAGGRGSLWCFSTDSSASQGCTPDYTASGYCSVMQYTSALPNYFQYFSDATLGGPKFFDGCPFIQAYSNGQCNVAKTLSDNDKVFGQYFGTAGRCFATTGLLQSGYSATAGSSYRCLESRCTDSGLVQLRVNGGSWETCTATNQQMSGFGGYNGAVVCPDAASFCKSFVTRTPSASPPTVSTPTPATTTSAQTPTATLSPLPSVSNRTQVLTTAGTLRFFGEKWRTVLAEQPGATSDAVRLSLALLFTLPTTSVEVSRLSIGSLVADYEINSVYQWGEIDSEFNEAVSNPSANAWLQPMLALYNATNSSDAPYLMTHTVDQTSQACQKVNMSKNTCYVVLVCAIVALFVFLAFFVWCCCCRRSDAEEHAEMKQARLQRHGASPTGPSCEPFDAADGRRRRQRGNKNTKSYGTADSV